MQLTFAECVKLIWIYFGIKLGISLAARFFLALIEVVEEERLHKSRKEIQNLDEEIERYKQQIEDYEKAKQDVQAKKIGFVSNRLEDS